MISLLREEAKVTAASAALSRILQGSVKPIVGMSKRIEGDLELGHCGPQAGSDLVDLHTNRCNKDEEAASGDAVYGKDMQPEQWVVGANLKEQHGPLADEEKVVGQGSRARRGIKHEEEGLGKAWEGLAYVSHQGGVISGEGDNEGAIKEETEQQASTLAHGIRGMEEFGKLGPRWNRREDFGGDRAEEVSRGFYNLCI